jgi:diguanylate cyclase (GGDEF)-like protein
MMVRRLTALLDSRSSWFDLGVFALGLVTVGATLFVLASNSEHIDLRVLVTIALIVVIARYPIVLDSGEGGIEVGFDSGVLMFLLCVLDPPKALIIWAAGVLLTQLTSQKRPTVKLFNVGLGIVAGAAAAVLYDLIGADHQGHPLELLGITVAATAYFAVDYVLSAVSVAIETSTPVREHLVQPGTLVAVACFVPFDLLGYLAAMVLRYTPWWTLILLAIPVATLLLASRAITRGAENSRRLTVLFDAAVRAQTLSDTRQVLDALVDDAQRLLRIGQVEVRATPPGSHEVGAQLRDGQRDRWIVAPAKHRARSTTTADQQALEAMVAVSSDAFARLRLTEDMTHLARHDLLTNLPNRGLLLDRVEHALEMSRRRSTRIALLFVDLDGFKPVNDRFGHAAGDAVLVDVAERLSSCVRQSDTVARLGGDEFALLLEDVNPAEVSTACQRILTALSRGAHVAGHQLSLSASIGVAFGDSSETPTWRCTRPSPGARTSTSSTSARSAGPGCSASSSSSPFDPRWPPGTSPWCTSRSCAPPPAGSSASRRSRGGSPTGSTYPPTCSSGSRRRPARSSRSATPCSRRSPAMRRPSWTWSVGTSSASR